MALVEYKFFRETPDIMWTPPWLKDGGHHYSPIDQSLIGWSLEPEEVSYFIPKEFKRLCRGEFIKRQLHINDLNPARKFIGDPRKGLDFGGLTDNPDDYVLVTQQEIIDEAGQWYDNYVTEMAQSLPQYAIDRLKKETIQNAFKYLESVVEDSIVIVSISGQNQTFGTDKVTQDNIVGINTAISVGIDVSNPTMWTPKGSVTPVPVTHQELAAIGGAILNKKDELYQVYFTHKSAINNLVETVDILKYDYSGGYN